MFIDSIAFVTPPSLTFARSTENVVLTFTGTLHSANTPTGPWIDITSTSPVTINAGSPTKFYRARQ